jgi:Family of unknown function (DUF5946)
MSEQRLAPAHETTACPGCGALVPDIDRPVHKYVPTSGGCWKTFGEVHADEANRFRYPPAHRVVVERGQNGMAARTQRPPQDGHVSIPISCLDRK